MLAIQKDVYSAYDSFLAQRSLPLSSKHGTPGCPVREAVAVLRRWNGQMDKDLAAPMITELLSTPAGAEPGAGFVRRPGLHHRRGRRPTFFRAPKSSRTSSKLGPRAGCRQRLGPLAARKSRRALAEGRKRQGTPVSKWRWGRLLEWNFAHPVGKATSAGRWLFRYRPCRDERIRHHRKTDHRYLRTLRADGRRSRRLGQIGAESHHWRIRQRRVQTL